jgi:hypothetical protein
MLISFFLKKRELKMRIRYFLRKLLPLKYNTNYRNSNNEFMKCSWWMWMGKPFHIINEKK